MQIDNNFINQYKNLIYKLIRDTGVKHPDTIQDIFSEVVIRIMHTKGNYDSERGAISTWLTLQTRSVVSNYFKKKSRSKDLIVSGQRLPLKDENQHETALKVLVNAKERDTTEARTEAYDVIWSSSLSRGNKEVLSDKVLHRMSVKEIAEKRGIKEDSVRMKVKRAMRKLKKEYEHQNINRED